MAKTKIEWTDFTVNFWEGCQKVGPGCDHCYAEARDVRFTGGSHWGPGAPRRKVKNGIPNLRRINRNADAFRAEHGRWPRIFCSSLSDVFDNAVDPAWRMEAFAALTVAPNTRPQLLTKRVGNVEKMIPATWRDGGWPHWAGLMITVVNQDEANRDIPKLLDLKSRLGIPWVGLSVEPLLGPVDLTKIPARDEYMSLFLDALGGTMEPADWVGEPRPYERLNWVIVGGESGPNARPMHPDWARGLRDQCEAAGTAFFFKQWGEWASELDRDNDDPDWRGDYGKVDRTDNKHRILNIEGGTGFHGERVHLMARVRKKAAGRLLDGREWNGVPG
jgi:protein gp37